MESAAHKKDMDYIGKLMQSFANKGTKKVRINDKDKDLSLLFIYDGPLFFVRFF